MRGHLPGLDTPHPLGLMLPGIYQADDFAQRFTGALDEVLAPVLGTLDCIWAYFDPRTAPEDFLDFVAGWLGTEFEQAWGLEQRRQVLVGAVGLHRPRGTAAGVRKAVALILDAPVEVVDSGAARWSQQPGSELPGASAPSLVVRIGVAPASDVERRRIDALVAAIKPAHVPHRIEWADASATSAAGEGEVVS